MTIIKKVVFERVFDSPPAAVWKAWTDPKMLKEWWGPNNVSIPECEVDLSVAGKFYIVMEAGEAMGPIKGMRWPIEGKFLVVETNLKLSYTARAWTEGREETTYVDQAAELTLTGENGKTKMELKVTINKTGPDAGMAVQGMEWGFNQQFDKLDKFLGKSPLTKDNS